MSWTKISPDTISKKHSIGLLNDSVFTEPVSTEHDRYFQHNSYENEVHDFVEKLLNQISAVEFSREDMADLLSFEMDKLVGTNNYSVKSLSDDAASIIRMYIKEDTRARDPEENLGSPFAELGLIQKSEARKRYFKKAQPIPSSLDKLVVMYILLETLGPEQNGISVDDLLYKPSSVGKTLNMGRSLLYEYLDRLRNAKLITLNRTAGLDMVYVPETLKPVDVLRDYY